MQLKENFTIASLLLMPLYFDKKLTVLDLTNNMDLEKVRSINSFVNAYTYDKNEPADLNQLYLLYDFKVDNAYVKLITKLKTLDNYVDDKFYIIDGVKYLMYRINPIDSLVDDIENIKAGHYTLISDEAKSLIFSFWGTYPEIIKKILVLLKTNSTSISEEIDENTYIRNSHLGDHVFTDGL